jgi:hypothetical protein
MLRLSCSFLMPFPSLKGSLPLTKFSDLTAEVLVVPRLLDQKDEISAAFWNELVIRIADNDGLEGVLIG